jgi:hypothetical protein
MPQYIITFGADLGDGYSVQQSKPYPAESESQAAESFKDLVESMEGTDCDIIQVAQV